jgi:hypothetical protein
MSTATEEGSLSRILHAGLWLTILVIAFFMQAIPFLLVLTMLNLAVGITSGAALIIIPAAAFGMLSFACWVATRRTKNLLPPPLRHQQVFISPIGDQKGDAQGNPVHARLLPVFKQWRWRH